MTSQLGRTSRPPRQASRAVRRGEQKKKRERVMSDERALRSTDKPTHAGTMPSQFAEDGEKCGYLFLGPTNGQNEQWRW